MKQAGFSYCTEMYKITIEALYLKGLMNLHQVDAWLLETLH
jgi:hypothetical protein